MICGDDGMVLNNRKLANTLLVDVGGERRMRYMLSIAREDSLGKYWESLRGGIRKRFDTR